MTVGESRQWRGEAVAVEMANQRHEREKEQRGEKIEVRLMHCGKRWGVTLEG